MGDPNAAPVPDPLDDGAQPPDAVPPVPPVTPARDESGWTDEWAERQWNDIVADLTAPGALGDPSAGGAGGDPSGPTQPGAPAGGAGLGAIEVAPWVQGAAPGRPRGPRDWPVTPEQEAAEDADSHFVPPEPPHLLGRDPLANLAWGVVALAPLLAIVLLVAVHPFPRLVGELAGVAFLAAVAVLVWRMPSRRDEDDDDTGAVV